MIGFGWVVNLVQRGTASLERLNELLQQCSEITAPEHAGSATRIARGDLEFRAVTFTYLGSASPAVDNVSFYAPAGQMIAILGATGSGKTTLMNLVPRLIDPQSGGVLIDGVDIREMPLATLREIVGFVPQDAFLFSQPVRDNIALGSPGAQDWEIFEAAETADVARDIAGFPNRFDTLLGERGITLSGGQKQRTTIARAVLKTPRILILDDAASSVDTLTEAAILKNLRVMRRNRTTLMVSHRVSTAQQADRIIVMAHGRIVESGRHEDLLTRDGYYAQLYQKQRIEADLETV
jgi:ATP-binding cassette subfamily B protein